MYTISVHLCFIVRWGVPAPRLIHFGLDQNGLVASHSHKGQNSNHRYYDEQDGHTCAHEPRSSHPQVTPLTHVPEVVSHEAAEAQTHTHLIRGGHSDTARGNVRRLLPTNRELSRVVRADAVMVAVVGMADGGAAVVGRPRLRRAAVTRRALQQPLAHVSLQACGRDSESQKTEKADAKGLKYLHSAASKRSVATEMRF